MDWSGVDYCDVFISCLDSHSDVSELIYILDGVSVSTFLANLHFFGGYICRPLSVVVYYTV